MFPNIPFHIAMCPVSRFTLPSALGYIAPEFSSVLWKGSSMVLKLASPFPNRENLNFLYVNQFLSLFEAQTMATLTVFKC